MNAKLRFYFLSITIIFVLSAYPLINGVRMAMLSMQNGIIEPEQYAKYVIPYFAVCAAVLLFAAAQPLFFKLKRFTFPIGLAAAYGVFFTVELFMERIKVNTLGMTLVDPSALTTDMISIAPGSVDIWQAALCIASPAVREQSVAFSSQNGFYYVMESSMYKIHYYMISLILITMVCGLVYGFWRLLHGSGQSKPLILQGISTAALISLCVFANTTAFFRQTQPIQTPLASLLTCLFFVIFGTAAGIYAGSYLLDKRKSIRTCIPVLTAVSATIAMYIGEAVMMQGNLYRFGTSWFFKEIPGIVMAPADIIVVLLSGVLTWLILIPAQRYIAWPGKRTAFFAVLLSIFAVVSGVVFSAFVSNPVSEDELFGLFGCYEFDECLYMNLFSSFIANKSSMPYIYGLSEGVFIEANMSSGDITQYEVQYKRTPVSIEDFPLITEPPGLNLLQPDLTQYKELYLLAKWSGGYSLYQMDGELWFVRSTEKEGLWSIYRLKKNYTTAYDDLSRAYAVREQQDGKTQMTLTDLYTLARKGSTLTLKDFEPFQYKLIGSDFSIRRYEVEFANTVTIFTKSGGTELDSVRLKSPRTLDENKAIDLCEGFDAVTAYLNPLHSLSDINIDDPRGGEEVRELIYDYDYDQCRYYLNTRRADTIFVVFEDGSSLPLKQALEERRITIENAVAHGLDDVTMVPTDNPLGGEFTVLHGMYRFTLEGEAFYPSKSFMYVVGDSNFSAYFSLEELADFLDWYGYESEANTLRSINNTVSLTVIAGKTYIRGIDLAEIGIDVSIDMADRSHTPVNFTINRQMQD